MIKLSRLNRQEIVVNSDLVEYIETTPDTVLTLVNGEKLVVMESVDEVVGKIIAFKQKILSGLDTAHQASGTAVFKPYVINKDPQS